MINCHFSYNYSQEGGGAVFISSGDPRFINCRFTENRSDDVGGALYTNSDLEIDGCSFLRNSSENFGGAIYGYVTPGIYISKCHFDSNTSQF